MRPDLMSDADLSAALASLPGDYPTADNGVHWTHEQIKHDPAFVRLCTHGGLWRATGLHLWTCPEPCGSSFLSPLGPRDVLPW